MSPLTTQEAMLVRGYTNSSVGDDQYSQATQRMYRIFYDQHDREWGADCEKKTQHPTGVGLQPRFKAPFIPPQKYLVITDTIRGRIHIDYVQMIRDGQEADTMFWGFAQQEANRIGGVRAQDLFDLQKRTLEPQLANLVGTPPMPITIYQALRAGNAWLLGKSDVKPVKMPREWFPDASDLAKADPFKMDDPFAELPEGAVVGESKTAPKDEYPAHRGGGRWILSLEHARAIEKDEADYFRGDKAGALSAITNGWQSPKLPDAKDEWND